MNLPANITDMAAAENLAIRIIWWCDIFFNIMAILFHCLGLYAIQKCSKKSNQKVILMSLSIAELVGAFYMLANDILRLIRYHPDMFHSVESMEKILANRLPPIYQEISFCLYLGSLFEILFILIILTVDRLVCALNPYHYRVHVTPERTVFMICITSALSMCSGMVYSLLPAAQFYIFTMFCVGAVIQLTTVLVSYSIIAYKIRRSVRSRTTSGQTESNIGDNQRFKKHYMIPALIFFTNFLFYLIPLSVQQLAIRRSELTPRKCIIHEGLSIILDIGILCDALIYEFLVKEYRIAVLKICSCCKGIQNPEPRIAIIQLQVRPKEIEPE